MMKKTMTAVIAAALALSVSTSAFAGRRVLRCDAEGVDDISMDAKYKKKNRRRKFDASFEAAAGGAFAAGDMLTVVVGGVEVGEMTLSIDPVSGDVVGDLEYDTKPDEGIPFPADFPKITKNMSVTVGPIGCDF